MTHRHSHTLLRVFLCALLVCALPLSALADLYIFGGGGGGSHDGTNSCAGGIGPGGNNGNSFAEGGLGGGGWVSNTSSNASSVAAPPLGTGSGNANGYPNATAGNGTAASGDIGGTGGFAEVLAHASIPDNIYIIGGGGGFGGGIPSNHPGIGGRAQLTGAADTAYAFANVLVEAGNAGSVSGFATTGGAAVFDFSANGSSVALDSLTVKCLGSSINSGLPNVYIRMLDVTGRDTLITPVLTYYDAIDLSSATIANGHTLALENSLGKLTCQALSVPSNQRGTLEVSNGVAFRLRTLNVPSNSTLTLRVGLDMKEKNSGLRATTANIAGSTIIPVLTTVPTMQKGDHLVLITGCDGAPSNVGSIYTDGSGKQYTMRLSGSELWLVLADGPVPPGPSPVPVLPQTGDSFPLWQLSLLLGLLGCAALWVARKARQAA